MPALRRPARRGRDLGRASRAEPRPHRAHARRRRRRRRPGCAAAVAGAPGRAARAGRARRARPTSPRPPSSSSRRCSCPAARSRLEGVGTQPDPDRAARDPRADGRRDRGRAGGRARRRADRHDPRPRLARCSGTEVGGDEIPLAIDELPLVALAACFAEGETTIRDAAELRRKESDRIATVCEALTALGADGRGRREDGMRDRGRAAACAAARSTPTATTASRCSARSPASPRARASRSRAWTPPRSATRASRPTSPRSLGGAPERRARAIRCRPWSSRSTGPPGPASPPSPARVAAALGFTYLDSGAMYRCVALAALERGADLDDAARDRRAGRARCAIELDGERVELDGARRQRRDPRAAGHRGRLARLGPSARCARRWSRGSAS